MSTALVLASASPARLAVLRAAGIDPAVRVSDVDEDAVVAALPADTPPAAVVVELARAKAEAVASTLPAGDCVVVGCDSMLLIDGALQGKPGSAAEARKRWAAMAGRTGELLTGHCVLRLRAGELIAEAAEHSGTTVAFGSPTPEQLETYLATGEPLQVAGAFTLDGMGGWFVDRIEGDPSSVIGIGLPLLRRLLAEVGVDVTRLWSTEASS
ncbi:MAG: septum formation inhibitor Maf [Mycobacteriaceae bacterium]|nr:septum formation inhibitor Maf [Mycobacteriaceae bacterium]